MKFLTIRTQKGLQPGVKTKKGILNIFEKVSTIQELIESYSDHTFREELNIFINNALKEEKNFSSLNQETFEMGPCVSDPMKIICVGLNYRKHAIESNMEIPETPVLFNKYNNTLAGHRENITVPDDAKQMDYEAELAVVIGKKGKNISKEDALEYVFGYCTANDISSRDLQFRSNQWLLGKNLDGFCPLGPYLVTADEIDDPNTLQISCKVNGDIRQNSNTSDMIFSCEEIISYISQYMTLKPGDVILTGTPEGVILGHPKSERIWLKDSDEITVEIEGLGELSNILKNTK